MTSRDPFQVSTVPGSMRFTFTSQGAHKENSFPATSDAMSEGQCLPDAKKHDSKRDDRLKQDKIGFLFQ